MLHKYNVQRMFFSSKKVGRNVIRPKDCATLKFIIVARTTEGRDRDSRVCRTSPLSTTSYNEKRKSSFFVEATSRWRSKCGLSSLFAVFRRAFRRTAPLEKQIMGSVAAEGGRMMRLQFAFRSSDPNFSLPYFLALRSSMANLY